MKGARLLCAVLFLLSLLATLAFLYATFRFGYIAALRPGKQTDPESDAACLSIFGALVSAFIAVLFGFGFAAADEEVRS